MSLGLDYAFLPHPTISALKTYGATFVGRYVSPQAANDTNGKNLLPAEATMLLGAGFQLILYEEQGAQRMLSGAAAGTADAQHFDQVVKALNMPGAVMFACADWDASEAETGPIHTYLDAVAAVLGRARTGLYGGFWPVWRAFNAGKISYAVQTRAWSSYSSSIPMPAHAVKWVVGTSTYFADSRAGVRQGQTVVVGGADCDALESVGPEFGQWPRPVNAWPGKWKRLLGTVFTGADLAGVGVGTDDRVYWERRAGTRWDASPVRIGGKLPGTWLERDADGSYHTGYPWGVALSPDGKTMFFTGTGIDYRLWQVALTLATMTFGAPYRIGDKVVMA